MVGKMPQPMCDSLPSSVKVACFHNGKFRARQKSVTQLLRFVRQVHVEIVCLLCVDACAQVFARLVRRAEQHGVGACQCTVEHIARGGAGVHADFEWSSGGVFGFGAFGYGVRHYFRGTGRVNPLIDET